jgi:hypothetical protein
LFLFLNNRWLTTNSTHCIMHPYDSNIIVRVGQIFTHRGIGKLSAP